MQVLVSRAAMKLEIAARPSLKFSTKIAGGNPIRSGTVRRERRRRQRGYRCTRWLGMGNRRIDDSGRYNEQNSACHQTLDHMLSRTHASCQRVSGQVDIQENRVLE